MSVTSSNTDLPELDWQAFCYLAGELSAEEAQAFESLLAEQLAVGDLSGSEAVARMMQRLDAIAATRPEPVEITASARSAVRRSSLSVERLPGERSAKWSALVGLTAVVAVALGLWFNSAPRTVEPGVGTVVATWSDLQEWPELAETERHAAEPMNPDVLSAEVATASEQGESDLSVPGWILTAVAQNAAAADGQPARMED